MKWCCCCFKPLRVVNPNIGRRAGACQSACVPVVGGKGKDLQRHGLTVQRAVTGAASQRTTNSLVRAAESEGHATTNRPRE